MKHQAEGSGSGNNMARFTDIAGVVRENGGDNCSVFVTPKNQGAREKEGNILNLNMEDNQGDLNIVLEAKRKRVDRQPNEMGYGPVLMQTDGPKQIEEIVDGLNVSKNLQGTGSGLQTRRELMSFLAWNCRRLANPQAVRFLKEITNQLRPNLIFLSETLVLKNKVEEVCKSIYYNGCFVIDAHGHGGD